MKRILTIAASDSGGGAGIQADIKTITVLGGYGLSAITALTAQNTVSVTAIHPVPPQFLQAQLDAVLTDIGADAAKTGMLYNAEIIRTVALAIDKYAMPNLVVDPVMRSKGGSCLLEDAAVEALKRVLLPLAALVTPNLDEAALLCGFPVAGLDDMKAAAMSIHALGPQNVLIKGGHLAGDCIDLLFDGKEFTTFAGKRFETKNTHGTGCTLSAAIATGLAQGLTMPDAVGRAKDYVATAIRFALPFGSGHGPTNHLAWTDRNAQCYTCGLELEAAVATLKQASIGRLMPEIQSNLGYGLLAAATPEDVMAYPGRIIRLEDSIITVAAPRPGASRHIAKIILTAMRYNPTYRSAMALCYTPDLIDCIKSLGFTVGEFDRREEPSNVKEIEGSSLEWGTKRAIEAAGGVVPDAIFDRGDVGKEPVTRILGASPADVARKIIKIAQEYKK
jgi:hydroxymethylpyrimidine kinase / phosphomethylpyrimidine kinase / thiamine-phosphate diphosphorylase